MKRLFIANRGEICRRIAFSARELGMETVCVVEAGKRPLFLQPVISFFYEVPEESPALYLDGDRMIAIAKEMSCDSVHPGFGFLSENASFATSVQQAGLAWVGPPPEAIRLMGDKAIARNYALKAQVPCTSGLLVDVGAEEGPEVRAFLAQTTGPLLIKAAKGGGGKGMRLVTDRSQLTESLERARSEALHAFGDGSVILEPYIEASRHVEAQILADAHGNIVILGDRDCSVQRRHQKVIEESPAPGLSPSTRKKLHESAHKLAKAMGYQSLGTVEFLVDGSSTGGEQAFYFLEMNTRLQVEHPVTEEVFGLDLVEWQLRVARGESLSQEVMASKPRGHSLEARLYAEDVEQGYLPTPGPVYGFFPAYAANVRWEVGMDQVDEIHPGFDPMVAKIVVRGDTREACMKRMAYVLKHSFFFGTICNREFLYLLVTETAFAKGPVTTHFLNDIRDSLLGRLREEREKAEAYVPHLQRTITFGVGESLGSGIPTVEGVTHRIFSGAPSVLGTHEKKGSVSSSWRHPNGAQCEYVTQFLDHDICYALRVQYGSSTQWVFQHGGFHGVKRVDREAWHGTAGEEDKSRDLTAPVPGKVIKILVGAGSVVTQGQPLVIIESMKIQFEITAPRKGVVSQILVAEQQLIAAAHILLHLDE